MRALFHKARRWIHAALRFERMIQENKMLTAKLLLESNLRKGVVEQLRQVEFQVFSQSGEDGIIQYLIHNIDVPTESRKFCEFGVERYTESNTRFLLLSSNWQGLVFDGHRQNIEFIQNDPIYYKYDLTAQCRFITRENINEVLAENGFSGEIGILSIDIDGMDYWVWEAVKETNPIITIVEYQSVFGADRAVTVPYQAGFVRTAAHHSNLYYGSSLKALCLLADKKGYFFVGCNSYGNNAFFVRKDKIGEIKKHTVKSGYVESRFRESRDAKGRLTFDSGARRLKAIEHLPVVDIGNGREVLLREIPGTGER